MRFHWILCLLHLQNPQLSWETGNAMMAEAKGMPYEEFISQMDILVEFSNKLREDDPKTKQEIENEERLKRSHQVIEEMHRLRKAAEKRP